MSRNRLTNRTASDMKSKPGTQVEDKGAGIDNDVYNMNDTGHEKNDPKIDEYAKGDPESWAEGVNKDKVNKDDSKREETGHAPLIDKHAAQEAIASARRLEEKAVKAIIASQRMLPGATDEIIEKQAGILMHLPEEGLNATLANQENLAKFIAKAAAESSEDEKMEEKKEEEKEEGKEAAEEKKEEEKEEGKEAAEEKKEEDEEASSKEALQQKLANLKKQAEEVQALLDGSKEATEDKKEEEKEEGKEAAEEKDEKKEEKAVEASDTSLLDQIFSGVMPSPIKKGASKLSGFVKKEASSGQSNDLAGIWESAPDVSEIFN